MKEQVDKASVAVDKSKSSEEAKKKEEGQHQQPPHLEPAHAKPEEEAAKSQEKHMLGPFPRHPANINLQQKHESPRVDAAITITDISEWRITLQGSS